MSNITPDLPGVVCTNCGAIGGWISEDDPPEWYVCPTCNGKGRIPYYESREDCPICYDAFNFLEWADAVGKPAGVGVYIGSPEPCPYHGGFE